MNIPMKRKNNNRRKLLLPVVGLVTISVVLIASVILLIKCANADNQLVAKALSTTTTTTETTTETTTNTTTTEITKATTTSTSTSTSATTTTSTTMSTTTVVSSTTEVVEYTTVEADSEYEDDLSYDSDYSGQILTASLGVVEGPSGTETYYNLDMTGVIEIMSEHGFQYEYWIRDDGVKMFGQYVTVAADLNIRPRGTILPTSLGTAIVCDTGTFAYTDPYKLDIAVSW